MYILILHLQFLLTKTIMILLLALTQRPQESRIWIEAMTQCIGPLQARYVNCLCYLFYAKVSGYSEFCESVYSLIFATQLMYTALLGIRGTWALLAKFIFSKIHANSSGNGLCSSLCQTTVALSDTGRLCPSTGTKLYLLLGVWTTCLRLCLKAKRPCVRTVTFEFWVQCLAITISYRDCEDLAWKPTFLHQWDDSYF